MACNAGPDIIEDGLVFCVDAANINSYPKTGTTWTDLKGGNAGTLTNGPTFSSDNAGSISTDGTNDIVQFSDDESIRINSGTSGTISMFVNVATNTGSFMALLSKSGGYDRGYEISVDQRSGKSNGLAVRPNSGSNVANFFTGYLDKWVFITVVFRGSDCIPYRNGEQYAQAAVQTTTGSGDDLILASRGTNSWHANCEYGIVMIHNRQLTADEIRQNYEATVGRYT